MKRCLINAVKIANFCSEQQAREMIADVAADYHDRMNQKQAVVIESEMEIDLDVEPDNELVQAMWDEARMITTERDKAIEILKRWSNKYKTDLETMAHIAEMSFNKCQRDDSEFLADVYEDVKHLSVETFKKLSNI